MRYYAWDPAKAASNYRKHGVRFEAALQVFEDPDALMAFDRIEAGEQRWQTIGIVDGVLLLVVAHTEDEDGDDELVRIISARFASRQERRRYEAARSSRSSR
jgi:uncharacterized DUF497 family protein